MVANDLAHSFAVVLTQPLLRDYVPLDHVLIGLGGCIPTTSVRVLRAVVSAERRGGFPTDLEGGAGLLRVDQLLPVLACGADGATPL